MLPPLIKIRKNLQESREKALSLLAPLGKEPCLHSTMLVCHQTRNRAQGYSSCTGKALVHTSSSRISAHRSETLSVGAAGWSCPMPRLLHALCKSVQCITRPTCSISAHQAQHPAAGPRSARLHGTALVAIAETQP